MGQTPPPDDVARRQPHPPSGSMAASSQYYRGAAATATALSHYRPLPGSHEHMYANLACHGPHGFPRATPGPRALFQRYFDYAGPSDYVNHQPSQQQQALAVNYIRSAPQEWAMSLNGDAYPSRQLPYVEDEVRAPVPHPSLSTRPHQHASIAAPIVPFNAQDPVYQPVEQQHEHLPDHVAGPTAPPLAQAPTLAPVASLLNYSNSTMHINAPHEPAQTPVHWPTSSNPEMLPSYPAQLPPHSNSTLPSDVVVAGQGHLPSSDWAMLDPHDGNNTYPVYEPAQQVEPDWRLVETSQLHRHDSNYPAARKDRARRSRRTEKKNVAKVTAAFIPRQPKTKHVKRQGPMAETSRAKTSKIRKLHLACFRCRFYKSGCDEGHPCAKCLKVEGNTRSFNLVCRRDQIGDTDLVRHCNGRLNQEEGEFCIYDWMQGSDLYSLEILWMLPLYGPISRNAPPMVLTYRQYCPNKQQLDTTVSSWRNIEGSFEIIEQPPYAIYDTASFMSAFERYFSSMQPDIEEWIYSRVRDDEIAWRTYNEVRRMRDQKRSEPNNILDLVMRIQCLSVVSQGYGTIVTQNIPGVREYDFGKMGRSTYEAYDRNSRERPLTAAMNHQMDVAALKYLKKLEKLCAKQLDKLVLQSKIKPWYEVFLALYVLFWNLEYIHHGAKKYINAKNGTAVQHQVNSVVSNQLKKWDYAIDVLLYHWQAVLRDFYPLKLARENPEELRLKGHIDDAAYQYVLRVVQIRDQNKFARSTVPYIGPPSTHDSLSSSWITALFDKASGPVEN